MPYIVMNLVVDTSVRSKSEDGEAQRDDENFAVTAWEYVGKPSEAVLHRSHWCMKMLN
jgi:hypothetical protein